MSVLSAIRSRLGAMFTTAQPVGDSAWWPIVREPYTGAWQKNDPITAPTPRSVIRVCSGACRRSAPISARSRRRSCSRRTPTGSGSRPRIPAYTPVLRTPNRYQTAQQFHEQIVLSLLLHGNAYLLKNRDERGVVNQLYVLDPSRVKVLVGAGWQRLLRAATERPGRHRHGRTADHRAGAGNHPHPHQLFLPSADGGLAALCRGGRGVASVTRSSRAVRRFSTVAADRPSP